MRMEMRAAVHHIVLLSKCFKLQDGSKRPTGDIDPFILQQAIKFAAHMTTRLDRNDERRIGL